jgi:hypothetical protein
MQVISATAIPSGTSGGVTTQVLSSKPSSGQIVGGTLGALALLTFTFIAFMVFRRKNKDDLHHNELLQETTNNVGASR